MDVSLKYFTVFDKLIHCEVTHPLQTPSFPKGFYQNVATPSMRIRGRGRAENILCRGVIFFSVLFLNVRLFSVIPRPSLAPQGCLVSVQDRTLCPDARPALSCVRWTRKESGDTQSTAGQRGRCGPSDSAALSARQCPWLKEAPLWPRCKWNRS